MIILQKIYMRLYTMITSRPCVSILKKWGMKVGNNLSVQNNVLLDISHCWLISIGDNVTLAPNVHILAHDASTKKFLNYTKISAVNIGNNVFVGAGSIVLPGCSIGDNVIIGAGSVVTTDLEANSVYFGIPCERFCSLEEYLSKFKNIPNELKFDESYTYRHITPNKKKEMQELLTSKTGLIK